MSTSKLDIVVVKKAIEALIKFEERKLSEKTVLIADNSKSIFVQVLN
jgi:hypothetical protein